MKFATATGKNRRASAFTLAEVLAALMFMAIVIPVAVESLQVAGASGEIAARRSEAARVADMVLNESVVTTNWMGSVQAGTVIDNSHEFRWTVNSQTWQPDSSMELLTAEVTFSTGAREYSVRMNTLVSSPNAVAGTGTAGGGGMR
jgi:type II secretory pathway pseudopilin PulG